MTNFYRKLQEQYYKENPDELKLEFGCDVNYLDFRERIHKGYVYYGEEVETRKPVLSRGKYDTVVVEKDCYTLIPLGKPLTLQMILRMLGKPYALSSLGHVLICPDSGEYYENTLIQLDLSKDPKDWDPETLEQLCKLLDIK